MADMYRVTYKNGEMEDVDEETLNAIESHITKAEPIKSAPVAPTAPAPTSYQYLPGDYADLQRNVGNVGYSGLDERQKALFKSQFPASKFARAGGTFEDAVKYVDSQSNSGQAQAMQGDRPYPVMESALPGEFSTDPRIGTFIKEHPGTVAATAASIPLTGGTSIPMGILGSGALGAGGTYVDESLAGNPEAGKSSMVSGLISGATHGIGSVVGAIGKKLAAPVMAGLAKEAETKLAAKAFAEGLKKEAIGASDAEIRLLNALGKSDGDDVFKQIAHMKGEDIAELVNMPPDKLRLALQDLPEHVRNAVYSKISNMMRVELPKYSALGTVNMGSKYSMAALMPSEGEVGEYVLNKLSPYTAKGWNMLAMAPNKYKVPIENLIPASMNDRFGVTNNFLIPKLVNSTSPMVQGLGAMLGPSFGAVGTKVRNEWEK